MEYLESLSLQTLSALIVNSFLRFLVLYFLGSRLVVVRDLIFVSSFILVPVSVQNRNGSGGIYAFTMVWYLLT